MRNTIVSPLWAGGSVDISKWIISWMFLLNIQILAVICNGQPQDFRGTCCYVILRSNSVVSVASSSNCFCRLLQKPFSFLIAVVRVVLRLLMFQLSTLNTSTGNLTANFWRRGGLTRHSRHLDDTTESVRRHDMFFCLVFFFVHSVSGKLFLSALVKVSLSRLSYKKSWD